MASLPMLGFPRILDTVETIILNDYVWQYMVV
jgi:hypothetical protein